jgi:predicted NodU family carbamoyl transferase
LIAAIEEERFTRVKHWAGFPAQAIQFCLQQAGITLNQVDYIGIGRNPNAKMLKTHWIYSWASHGRHECYQLEIKKTGYMSVHWKKNFVNWMLLVMKNR